MTRSAAGDAAGRQTDGQDLKQSLPESECSAAAAAAGVLFVHTLDFPSPATQHRGHLQQRVMCEIKNDANS